MKPYKGEKRRGDIMIKLENINKTYRTGKTVFQALKNINLSIEKGEFIAILGKSGSGKTTLLNIIGLLDSFEEGKYILNKTDVSSLSENKKASYRNNKIGVVLQDYSLINHKKVMFNVMLPLYFDKRCSYFHMKKRAMEMLNIMGIADQAEKKAINLSGGQRQRAAIARAMINEPDIILADEPTGALDSKTAGEIMDIFAELNKKGVTVIIVTHDTDVAKRCGRIIEIMDGRIVKDEVR